MSASDVEGCVNLVVFAFEEAADLMSRLTKKSKQQKGERRQHEQLLLNVLSIGAAQVQERYQEGVQRFGSQMTIGDENTRSSLILVALSINGGIVQNLQIALDREYAVLNLHQLHSSGVNSRYEAIRVLDELIDSLNEASLLCQSPASLSSASSLSLNLPHRPSPLSTVHTPPTPVIAELPSECIVELPGDVPTYFQLPTPPRREAPREIREPPREEKLGFRRFFSRSSSLRSRSKTSPQKSPGLLSIRSRSSESVTKVIVQEPQSNLPVELPAIHPVSMRNMQPRPLAGLAIANAVTPIITQFPDHNNIAELDSSAVVEIDDTNSIATTDQYEDDDDDEDEDDDDDEDDDEDDDNDEDDDGEESGDEESLHSSMDGTPDTPNTSYSASSPNSPSLENTMARPISPISEEESDIDTTSLTATSVSRSKSSRRFSNSSLISKPVLDRPNKSNNYHNFCRGAWSSRSTPLAALNLRMLPSTLGSLSPHYTCKWCTFRSPALNAQKSLPDTIYISGQGIAYRWLYLMRSHARCTDPKAGGARNWPLSSNLPSMSGRGEEFDGYEFGCIFCSVEGNETKVYKDVESLMMHVDMRHAGRIDEDVLKKTRCVDGRVAEKKESWDVNICQFDV